MDETRLVIADGRVARRYRTDATFSFLERIDEVKNDYAAPEHRRRPEGGHDSGHHNEEAQFAADLAHTLHLDATAQGFGALVIVAPPHFLGDLRHHITKPVQERIDVEIAKELTDVSDHDLPARMLDLLKDRPLTPAE